MVDALDVGRACGYLYSKQASKLCWSRNSQFFRSKILQHSQTLVRYFAYAALLDYVRLRDLYPAGSDELVNARKKS